MSPSQEDVAIENQEPTSSISQRQQRQSPIAIGQQEPKRIELNGETTGSLVSYPGGKFQPVPFGRTANNDNNVAVRILEKSVIIHKDDRGFGLRIRGHAPVFVEHVHVGGAAWRAGVRLNDTISRINGIPISNLDHKSVVLMLKSCTHFVALTLLCVLKRTNSSSTQSTQVAASPPSLCFSPRISNLSNLSQQATDSKQTALKRIAQVKQYSCSSGDDEDDDDASKNCAGGLPSFCICCRAFLSDSKAPGAGGNTCKDCLQKIKQARQVAATRTYLRPTPHGGSLREQAQTGGGHQQRLATYSAGTSTTGNVQLQQQAQKNSHALRMKVNQRLEIIREFLDTERAHTERLRCLDELFYRPLKAEKLMTNQQLKMVFSCHRKLYRLHRQIYRILLSATSVCGATGDEQVPTMCARLRPNGAASLEQAPFIGSALGEIFEGELRRELERAVCTFCSAQALNVDLLNRLTRRDTKVGEFLAHVTSQRIVLGRLGIKDLLASCFQRVTKYPLLLENLLRATPSEAPPVSPDEDDTNLLATLERDSCGGSLEWCAGESLELRARLEADDQDQQPSELERQLLAVRRQERRNSRRMLSISLAEERDSIERSLQQSRQILVKVNESVSVAMARQRFREIWRRTERAPNLPHIEVNKQQLLHEGTLTLRLSKRAFEVHMLLLNDYILILTRDAREDRFRLRYFTPEGKAAAATSSSAGLQGASLSGAPSSVQFASNTDLVSSGRQEHHHNQQQHLANSNQLGPSLAASNQVYSPIFHIDEHLTTRDAATDENGFYLLCKRRDDSRIYELAARSPAERSKWRDLIQWTVERQMEGSQRRASCESTLTRSSIASADSVRGTAAVDLLAPAAPHARRRTGSGPPLEMVSSRHNHHHHPHHHHHHHHHQQVTPEHTSAASVRRHRKAALNSHEQNKQQHQLTVNAVSGAIGAASSGSSRPSTPTNGEPTRIVGTISYVIDDEIVMPSKMESSRVFVDQAIQVNILDGTITTGAPTSAVTLSGSSKQ